GYSRLVLITCRSVQRCHQRVSPTGLSASGPSSGIGFGEKELPSPVSPHLLPVAAVFFCATQGALSAGRVLAFPFPVVGGGYARWDRLHPLADMDRAFLVQAGCPLLHGRLAQTSAFLNVFAGAGECIKKPLAVHAITCAAAMPNG